MIKFVSKVIALLGVIASYILFIVVSFFVFYAIFSSDALNTMFANANLASLWIKIILSILSIITILVATIIATVHLINSSKRRTESYMFLSVLPVLIADLIYFLVVPSNYSIYLNFPIGFIIAYIVISFVLFITTLKIEK